MKDLNASLRAATPALRTSSRLGQMEPSSLYRVLRAGQRRSLCLGVSASSRHALPGWRLPDPVSPLGGAGPVASSQMVDVDRGRPVSSSDRRGGTISRQYPPVRTVSAFVPWWVRARASPAASRCAIMTSTAEVVWSMELASSAMVSTRSLSPRPQCED